VSQIAAKVDPGVVDVNTQLGYEDASGAGTGMVLTPTGVVLTNNHVVDGATSISVTDVGNGRTYTATVVGTDSADDVAVLQLSGASGLTTVHIGSSSTLKVGESVVAIGNAGGVGGSPSVSSGAVTDLNQSIAASDEFSGTTEQLSGLVETDATLEAGDSGGPLVDTSGRVAGMDTAASGGFQLQSGSSQSFAIPIDHALAIAAQIEAGDASSTIHIGPTAFLGVEVETATGLPGGSSSPGAAVVTVESGSPAGQAGLTTGDVIDSLDGRNVDSPDTLSGIIEDLRPGDSVELGWTDLSGRQQTGTVQLATGPAA
jgi:S1-C subfamily serine protease